MIAVNAATMEGSKCTATGDGLSKARAGIPASFPIKAADPPGNRRSTGAPAPACSSSDTVTPTVRKYSAEALQLLQVATSLM